jgi:hypothetical protein
MKKCIEFYSYCPEIDLKKAGYVTWRNNGFVRQIDTKRRYHAIIIGTKIQLHQDNLKWDENGKSYHKTQFNRKFWPEVNRIKKWQDV